MGNIYTRSYATALERNIKKHHDEIEAKVRYEFRVVHGVRMRIKIYPTMHAMGVVPNSKDTNRFVGDRRGRKEVDTKA